ncbi:TetR/AcrR family transcriptional regulator [Yinghuangia soli]|uniref:TetR/AcrR family transcriptional regulator n=1 Tax=Yinghuangia soli TaxID=2908204 RepID=A0AA41TWQ9_9ACTN|nr:helix-turn-helix domain-containing protein [Yinghuangia soli]MCF2526093.1 TetR/AcrR family transcriptional regulator [Yinghuangia soli]
MDVKTETRARILDAAERLFAERGVADVSLREIGAAAGQRNNSAVQYHFGTRDALVRALYEDRLAPLNRRRLELLASLPEDLPATGPGALDALDRLVDVYVRPLAEAMRDGRADSHYARFIHRFTLEGAPVTPPLGAETTGGVREVLARLDAALAAAAPGQAPARRALRLRLMHLLVTATLADTERRLADGVEIDLPFDELIGELKAAAVGVLAEPEPEPGTDPGPGTAPESGTGIGTGANPARASGGRAHGSRAGSRAASSSSARRKSAS